MTNRYAESSEVIIDRLTVLVQNMVIQGQRALLVESVQQQKKEEVDFREMRSTILIVSLYTLNEREYSP